MDDPIRPEYNPYISGINPETDPSKREFLFSLALFSCSMILGIMPGGSLAASDRQKDARQDLIYFSHHDLQNVLDYRDDIESLFDSDTRKQLRIVRTPPLFSLICALNLSEKSAEELALKHCHLLAEHGFDEVRPIKSKAYESLHNVSYGLGPNLDALRKRYRLIYQVLGDKLGKDLVIEKTHHHNYALVYKVLKRGGTAWDIAKEHRRILRKNKQKIGVSTIIDQNHEVVCEASDILAEVPPFSAQKKGAPNDGHANFPDAEALFLEKKIDCYIKGLRRKGIISSDEETAWSVYDFTMEEKLVSINEDIPHQSASMIKPFIALAFFCKRDENKKNFKYFRKRVRRMEAMIRRSSNSATNYFIHLIGKTPREVENVLRGNYPGIFKDTRIVEYIPKNGRTYQNKASAKDYSRFLYALWHNQLPYSNEIKRLMRLPNNDRIYKGAKRVPAGTLVYDKTGTTARLCGNMGILVAKGKDGRRYPYTLIGIIEKSERARNYPRWKASRSNIIRSVSNIVYGELRKKHNLI